MGIMRWKESPPMLAIKYTKVKVKLHPSQREDDKWWFTFKGIKTYVDNDTIIFHVLDRKDINIKVDELVLFELTEL